MGFNQAGEAVVKRLPMACDLSTRSLGSGVSWTRDSYLQNAYVEFDPTNNTPNVVKRPALIAGGIGNAGSTATIAAQGMFNYGIGGTLYLWAINNNTLWNVTGSGIAHGSASGATWITKTPSPVMKLLDRDSFPAIVFKNQIMILGGYQTSLGGVNSGSISSTSDGNTWTTLTSSPQWAAPFGRRRSTAAVLGDILYMMNGFIGLSGAPANDCWLSNDGIDWSVATADMGTAAGIYPRYLAATVTFNNNIVMIGGWEYPPTAAAAIGNTVISSPDGKTWTKNTTPAFTARITAACVFKGAIYCVGGINAAGAMLEEVWKSVDGNTWVNVYGTGFGGIGAEKAFQSVVVLGNLMYAFAYTETGTASIRKAYSSPDGVTWTALATPPWAAGSNAPLVVFPPPLGQSGYPQYPQDVIWMVSPDVNATYFTDLNTNYSASYSISTGGAVTDQFETGTINLGKYLVLKNTTDGHVYSANSVNKIADQNYPGATVRGLAILNSRAYVMDTLGNIRGSKIGDPTVWPALNYIRADFNGDSPVCLARYANYLVALKTNSMMFFSDNGKSVGNSVSPILNANSLVGCGQGYSVVEMSNTIIFMSTNGKMRRSISRLNGFQSEKVSTDDVDRILDANPCTTVYSFSLKMGGQELYLLTLTDSPATTLCFNNSTGKWSIWASGADGVTTGTLPLRGINRTGLGQKTYLQDLKTYNVLEVTDTSFQDTDVAAVTTAITTIIQPNKVDAGTHQPKFCAAVDIIGDYYSTTNPLTVAKSDDDGVTFSTIGTAELSNLRPHVNRGGRFVRRIHRFTHTANQPLRLTDYEVTIEPGDV